MKRVYFGTKQVRMSGCAPIIYLDKYWGFKPNDVIEFTIYNIDEPEVVYSTVKKVCRIGGATGIFCDKSWGFKRDDIVVIKAVLRGKVIDTGVEAEEGDQSVSD